MDVNNAMNKDVSSVINSSNLTINMDMGIANHNHNRQVARKQKNNIEMVFKSNITEKIAKSAMKDINR